MNKKRDKITPITDSWLFLDKLVQRSVVWSAKLGEDGELSGKLESQPLKHGELIKMWTNNRSRDPLSAFPLISGVNKLSFSSSFLLRAQQKFLFVIHCGEISRVDLGENWRRVFVSLTDDRTGVNNQSAQTL